MSESTVPEVYVDEIEGALVGFPLSKLVFTSTQPNITKVGTPPEPQKRHVLTITIPTLALAKACKTILSTLPGNQDGIVAASQGMQQALMQEIQSINIPVPPSALTASPPKPTKPK